MLAEGVVPEAERDRFLAAVEGLPGLGAGDLGALGIAVPAERLLAAKPGLFDRSAPARTPETV